ncbi:hypothetical protein K458DRAFT_331710 [Lentithecium fluviatile CBS 122367]|uniref:Rhodopsin domain-containing protein n=1 Tax=Lentithecium fluviatile CBS 122367 TaxID=1168545 RepID=A0A6G1JFI7_9PLEO|nr:hypothetical protein K458DRAFT_331710 [Lentithecium fluviatile CBS 122367]
MASQAPASVFTPSAPRFSLEVFRGVAWAGFSLATVFVLFRTFLRFHHFRRLFLDDAFVFIGWTMALVTTILWHLFAGDMFTNNAVARGAQIPGSDFVQRSEAFLTASAAVIFLFYSTLWSVKLSFLFFFRRLYVNVGSWMRYWWIILAFTMASWAVCVGNIEYKCLVSPLEYLVLHCNGDKSRRYQRTTLIVNCVFDLVTDVLITSIPITMLWKVRISLKRKLALGVVFSVTVFTMVFAIARVGLLSTKSYRQDMTWLYFWSNIEGYAALIVSSLGSFRTLFRSQDSDSKPSRPADAPYTIGSPQKKRNLHSFAHIFTSSLAKTNFSESTQDFVELKEPAKVHSVSTSMVDRVDSYDSNVHREANAI